MDQEDLWYDTLEGALRAVVNAIGVKKVATKFCPDLPQERAVTWLDDALNPGRRAKLSLGQVMLLLKWGREAGCHTAINFVASECGYAQPVPTEPDDEKQALQREFVQSVSRLQSLAQQIKQSEERATRLRAVS